MRLYSLSPNLVCLAAFCVVFTVVPAVAQPFPELSSSPPLERFLAPDGSLMISSGISTSIDPGGWRMIPGADGSPRFVRDGALPECGVVARAVPADARWSDRFGLLGVGGRSGGEVNALALDGDKLYVGGRFTIAGNVSASGIAVWNISSQTWSSLGRGIGPFGSVNAILVAGGDVYVGGDFDSAGTIRSVGVARWDGSVWHTMDSGVVGAESFDKSGAWVNSLVTVGDDLYVGGSFKRAGGVTAANIARWNMPTGQWSSVGSGVDGPVLAMDVDGSTLYVGGYFAEAGGVFARSVARWDAGGWSSIGSGLDSIVTSLRVVGHDLYAAGYIFSSGTTSLRSFVRWDGSSWATVGGGLPSGRYTGIYDRGGSLYIVGGTSPSSSAVEIWDGTSWASIGGRSKGYPTQALAFVGQEVYVGGSFRRIGDIAVYNVARWDGSAWSGLVSGFDLGTMEIVMDIVADGADLYASGYIDQVGGAAVAHNIAKWDGTRWSVVGDSLSWVNAFAVMNGDLYVAGGFDTSVVDPPRGVAHWNGTSWVPLGSGVEGGIYTMAVFNGDLIVGGTITKAGGVPVRNLARWDGSSWSSFGDGVDSTVMSLDVAPNGDLYVGGYFNHAGSVEARGVARWNGTGWESLGIGVENGAGPSVSAVGADAAGNVYVAGTLSRAGSRPVSGIARWDGSAWSELGGGTSNSYRFDSSVRSLAVTPAGKVYVGGSFTSIGGVPASSVACWDGSGWTSLGSGIEVVTPFANGWTSTSIGSITVLGDDIYIGGQFTTAGGKVSTGLARWSEKISTVRSDVEAGADLRVETFPNPTSGVIEMAYELPEAAVTSLRIFSPLGRECARLVDGWREAGRHTLRWDVDDCADGLYLCRLRSGDRVVTVRIVVDR